MNKAGRVISIAPIVAGVVLDIPSWLSYLGIESEFLISFANSNFYRAVPLI